jgi:hypothetical protein
MRRFWPGLALAATTVAACTGSSYTVESANIDNANERAARYCSNREATAQLEHVHQNGGTSVETYRCIAAE